MRKAHRALETIRHRSAPYCSSDCGMGLLKWTKTLPTQTAPLVILIHTEFETILLIISWPHSDVPNYLNVFLVHNVAK